MGQQLHGLRAQSCPVRKLQLYCVSRFQAQEGGHLRIVVARAHNDNYTQCDEELTFSLFTLQESNPCSQQSGQVVGAVGRAWLPFKQLVAAVGE